MMRNHFKMSFHLSKHFSESYNLQRKSKIYSFLLIDSEIQETLLMPLLLMNGCNYDLSRS